MLNNVVMQATHTNKTEGMTTMICTDCDNTVGTNMSCSACALFVACEEDARFDLADAITEEVL